MKTKILLTFCLIVIMTGSEKLLQSQERTSLISNGNRNIVLLPIQANIICGLNDGTSGNQDAMPINVYYEGNRIQWILTASEISNGGWSSGSAAITSISFYVTSPPIVNPDGWSIRMKNTIANTTVSHDGTGLTTVLGPISTNWSGTTSGGWWGFELTSNFTWNGSSNILIDVCFGENPAWDASGQIEITNYTNGSRYYRADNAGSLCNATTSSIYNFKPQTMLGMSTVSPPGNNSCLGAIQLPVFGSSCGGATQGNVYGATQTKMGCVGTAEDDVWYYFIPTSTSHDITVVGSPNFDAVVELFSLSSPNCAMLGALNSVICRDNTNTGGTEIINATSLTIGTPYYIRVYDYYSSEPSTTTFNICVTTPGAGGINESSLTSGAIIYPNPTSETFTITTTENNYSLIITNPIGEKIFLQKIISEKSEIDLSNHPNGIYFVNINFEKGSIFKKIILQK